MSKMKKFREYEYLSKYYDMLMKDLDYLNKSNKISKIFKKFRIKKIIDLGCGTGSFTICLKKHGFECMGVDKSKAMINKAQKKDKTITWIVADITNLKIINKFDGVICLFDTVNYILNKKDLSSFFKNVNGILNKNGIFLFDINTKNKKSSLKGRYIQKRINKNLKLIWSNNVKGDIWTANMVFIKNSKKFVEVHKERLYGVSEIRKYLEKNNFRILKIYDDMDFKKIVNEKKSTRALFLTQKKSS